MHFRSPSGRNTWTNQTTASVFSENVILSGRDDWLKEDAPFSWRNRDKFNRPLFIIIITQKI